MISSDKVKDARTVVVVLGARSGTSALAGTLGMLGCVLPKRLMGACSSNEKGHFEPIVIANLHDSLLAEAGSAWDDWRLFPPGWHDTAACPEYLDRLQAAFTEDYGDFSLAVLKEPRMGRLLPLWWRLLGRVGAQAAPVFIYRDPVEVAQSLATRDASTMLHGLLYWLRNQLDAEFFTRGMRRSFVLFDELLEDWRKVASRIETEQDIRFPRLDAAGAEVDAFLEPRLRHQRRLAPAIAGTDVLTDWTQAVFALFNALRADPADPAALQKLDGIRAAFNRHTHSRTLDDAAVREAKLILS
jgi:hypothetical protein